jgi:hypothetical protein
VPPDEGALNDDEAMDHHAPDEPVA